MRSITGENVKKESALATLQEIFDQLFMSPVRLRSELVASDVPEWDSLMHINIVIATEKAFGIRFRLGEVEKTNTVGELIDLVLERLEVP